MKEIHEPDLKQATVLSPAQLNAVRLCGSTNPADTCES